MHLAVKGAPNHVLRVGVKGVDLRKHPEEMAKSILKGIKVN